MKKLNEKAEFRVLSLFCSAVVSVISSFAIIVLRSIELVDCILGVMWMLILYVSSLRSGGL